jgi:hypothetical protein
MDINVHLFQEKIRIAFTQLKDKNKKLSSRLSETESTYTTKETELINNIRRLKENNASLSDRLTEKENHLSQARLDLDQQRELLEIQVKEGRERQRNLQLLHNQLNSAKQTNIELELKLKEALQAKEELLESFRKESLLHSTNLAQMKSSLEEKLNQAMEKLLKYLIVLSFIKLCRGHAEELKLGQDKEAEALCKAQIIERDYKKDLESLKDEHHHTLQSKKTIFGNILEVERKFKELQVAFEDTTRENAELKQVPFIILNLT